MLSLSLDYHSFSRLFDSVSEAVITVEIGSRHIVQWNLGAERSFGYKASEVLGQSVEFLDFEHATLEEICRAAMPEIKHRRPWRTQRAFRHRDGSVFPADVTAVGIDSASLPAGYLVIVLRDLPQPKEFGAQAHGFNQELARLASEPKEAPPARFGGLSDFQNDHWITAEQLALLFQGIRDYAILLLDAGGRILTWNSGARQVFGHEAKEIVGTSWSSLFPESGEAQGPARQTLERARVKGSLDERTWLLTRHGSRIHADLFIAPCYDSAGELTNYSLLIRDVTERVELREKLREKEHLATMGTTASLFAHEISNPLNGIATTIQIFERTLTQGDFSDRASALSCLEELKSEIRRLRALLDEFKTLARPMTLDLKSVDMVALVSQLVKLLAVDFERANVECTLELPEALPIINGDPDKLKQALLNLVKNAIEAMPKGGRISVRGYERGAQLCFEITDTGTGIPEGLRIFDLFQTTKPGGTGLGLVVVQQVIAAHGGSVSYRSRSGVGTTFHVALPRKSV